MSNPNHPTADQAFERVCQTLGAPSEAFWFRSWPAEQAERLTGRIKLAAKLLSRATSVGHSQALDMVAQALRFPAWHQLAAHLARAEDWTVDPPPAGWLDALQAAAVLLPVPDDEVALAAGHARALEQFGGALAMLTDAPLQQVLDDVVARLCGGQRWTEVRQRHPLQATRPLYSVQVHAQGAEGNVPEAVFQVSAACAELVEELDEVWQGYGEFTAARKRQARRWVEQALAAQPGFLEAGLALAGMQHAAKDPAAAATVAHWVRRAEALVPKGFKGTMTWGHVDNRFYHRLLWLQMTIGSEWGDLPLAIKAARKQLRLNPRDNLGVREILPGLLLRQGQVDAARRSLKHLTGEVGLGASALRAFVAFAAGDLQQYRRELALALFTLPWLRRLLLGSKAGVLAADETGFRQVRPDLELLLDFAWPAYAAVPGLRAATERLLGEARVVEAERLLRAQWLACQAAPRTAPMGQPSALQAWMDMVNEQADLVAA